MERDFDIHNWQAKFLKESQRRLVKEDLQSDLLLANDGPLSTFGVIQRAIEMAESNRVSTIALSNALYEALKEIGALKDIDIPSNEFR
jgi:hypothetical protein